MNGIDKIWSNGIGISFYWKEHSCAYTNKVQLIFKDIGFLLTLEELKKFASLCLLANETGNCHSCPHSRHCRSLLLRTPAPTIDVAVSSNELKDIATLISQTILKVEAHSFLQQHLN